MLFISFIFASDFSSYPAIWNITMCYNKVHIHVKLARDYPLFINNLASYTLFIKSTILQLIHFVGVNMAIFQVEITCKSNKAIGKSSRTKT